jgi:DNA-binding NarL/FixJ family response regulator
MRISVLLSDNNEIVRKVIVDLLQADPEIEVVAECSSFAQTMERASKLHPQVFVLDVRIGDERTVTPSHLKFGLIGSRLLAISIWKDDETKTLAERIEAATLVCKPGCFTDPSYKALRQRQRTGTSDRVSKMKESGLPGSINSARQ